MGAPLEVLILGLISTPLLWEGAMPAKLPGYDLKAPAIVSVEEELCVVINCNFTYPAKDALSDATLYGFWYDTEKSSKEDAPVATNSVKTVADFALNRFHLIGNLEEGNCSLLISHVKQTDRKKYVFRMEKENKAKFTFKDYVQPLLDVKERQAPEIQILGKLRVGYPANITCGAFRSCSWLSPSITWKGFSKNISAHLWLNGTQAYSSVLNFIPSAADHNRTLTCTVSYANTSSSVSKVKTVQLDVNYRPKTPVISGEYLYNNTSLRNFTKLFQLKINEGHTILLRCKAKGNPLPNVTWVKGSQILGSSPRSYHTLKLSDMKMEDAGEYKCQAANSEGSTETSLELFVAPEDINNCLPSIVTGVLVSLGAVLLIIGIIFASKRCRRRRRKTVTDSETEPKHSASAPGNISPNFKNINASDLDLQKMDSSFPKPESTEESDDRTPRDPEEIHYATLKFNVPNPIPDATSEEIQNDYAEIRHGGSQGKQGMKI